MKNISYLKFSATWGTVRVRSGVANLASKREGPNPSGFRDMAFFMIFFQKNWMKKTLPENLNHVGYCSGYAHGLQVWRPNMTAQILMVFEIWRFL